MQIFKKALSLVLTLALVLTCAPALAGTVSAAMTVPADTVFTDLQAVDSEKVTLHGVSYMPYTDKDGSDGTVYMYGRIDNDTAVSIQTNDSLSSHGGSVYWHAREAAGGRIRFATNSSYVAINATLFDRNKYSYTMAAGKYGFSVYVDSANGSTHAGTVSGTAPSTSPSTVPVNGAIDLSSFPTDENGYRSVTIYFPIIIETRQVSLGIAPDAAYQAHTVPYSNPDAPIVFYGSSITQGGASTDPSYAYTARVSRALNAEYISFGMWGSCAGQSKFAEYMAGLDMSVFVLDYDHNESDSTTLKSKQLAVYQKIREAHPNIPIIMITRPNRNLTYDTRYPDTTEDMKTAILENYYSVVGNDPNVHFIDGEAFFNYDGSLPSDAGYKWYMGFLSDGTHPTDKGQAAMADVVANVISLANAGIKNIYVDKDEISFAGNAKEDILFDSTNAVGAMTQADWTGGTVSDKTLVLDAGASATVNVDGANKWSGYTAVADLTVAAGASATVTVGGKTLTLSALSKTSCTVTVDGTTRVLAPATELTQNANGSIRLVLSLKLMNDQFCICVNGTEDFFEAGVMGGAPTFGAIDGQVTVNSLLIIAPTQRSHYTASLGDKIGLNIHMSLTEAAAADTGSYMVFTCGDTVSDPVALPEPDADGTYAFSFQVAAKEMADEVIAAFYNSNGEMIAKHVTTVKDYATYIIDTEGYSDKDKAIATALLNYGAAAQLHFEHNAENLANGGFASGWDAELDTAVLSSHTPTASGSLPEGVEFCGTSLIMEGYTTIRHYFKMDAATAEGLTATVGGASLPITESEENPGYYCVSITGVDAANLDYAFTLTLTDGTNTIDISYSALSYAYLVLNNASYNGSTLEQLVKAIVLYSTSVEAKPEAGDNEFEILPF